MTKISQFKTLISFTSIFLGEVDSRRSIHKKYAMSSFDIFNEIKYEKTKHNKKAIR